MPVITVVMVHADRALCEICTQILVDAGYTVKAAAPEPPLAEQLRRQQPQIIIVAVQGPTDPGIALSRQLKAAPEPPAVLLLSTYPDIAELQTQAGADAVLGEH